MLLEIKVVAARIAALALFASFVPGVGAAQPPLLRVDTDAPLALAGSGFRPREPVEVSIVMGTRHLETVAVASDAGEFTVRFAGTRLDRCATPLVITAKGEKSGSVAASLPLRECAAP